tara:strand:+ start:986 stop:1765 length:780 start_codon:yes stop_codon:yes gene_type:complete
MNTRELPEFLKAYEADLKAYERTYIRIQAQPRKEQLFQDPLAITSSKFLGKPFFPKDRAYPKDKKGNPMVMIAQLNFSEIPKLSPFPEDGILQLFLSVTDWYEEDAAVIYHTAEDMLQEARSDFSFFSEDDLEELPVFNLHQLSFEKAIDYGGMEDVQFDYRFAEQNFWDFLDRLTEEQEALMYAYFDASGHKIGGYAEFTQEDPRGFDMHQLDDVQLLQIDTDDHIMFGDSGLGHLFIPKEDLLQKDFSKAYFSWDCC